MTVYQYVVLVEGVDDTVIIATKKVKLRTNQRNVSSRLSELNNGSQVYPQWFLTVLSASKTLDDRDTENRRV